MQGDIFTSSKNTFKTSTDENNFFLQPEDVAAKNITTTQRHLNDYDFNLLKEDAYKDISDDAFKLEYQIAKTEEEIIDLDKQIQAAKDIRDFELAESLFEKRKGLSENIKTLNAMYNQASLSAKISGGITAKFKQNIDNIKRNLLNSCELLLSKIPGKLSTVMEIKSSLDKLENINKSVDELMSMKIPYGESNYRYDILSKYISKANSIQSEISKVIR